MMPAAIRAQANFLLRHPWQLALAVLGIVIGVAVIVAVDVANSSARKAFLLSMDAITGAATHQVVGGPLGVDETVYRDLRVERGMRQIAPLVEGYVSVEQTSLQVLGVDIFAERDMREFTSRSTGGTRDGQDLVRDMLTLPGAATMAEDTAGRLGLAVGDGFVVSTRGKEFPATLVGVFDSGDVAGLEAMLTVDIATAQAWFDRVGWLTRIDVRLDGSGVDEQTMTEWLPGNVRLLSAAARTQNTADLSAAFMTNLTAMSLLALLVGLFLIYNSVSFSVLQRRRLIGILRALGITRRQTISVVLVEAAIIGVIAASLGVAVGAWLGEQLLALVAQSINDLYYRVSVTDVRPTALTVAKGVVAGIAAAMAAAAVPAIEASSYEPRLAMTRSSLERKTRSLLPSIAGAGLATSLGAVLLLIVSGRSLVAGLTAVFMLILGFALFVPIAVKAMTGLLAPLVGRVAGLPARIAIADIGASLSRTGVAVIALAVAVSATIGVQVMVDSFRGSVTDWLEQTLQADIYVGVERGSIDAELVEALTAVDGIDAYSTSRRAWIEDEDGRTQLLAIAMAPGSYAGTQILDADPAEVWAKFESHDVVLVSEPYAYMNEVQRGESIRLQTDSGERRFRVSATYQSFDISASAVLISRDRYDRYFHDRNVDGIGLYIANGVTVERVIADLEAVADGKQQIVINSNARIRELSLEIFDRTFTITNVLYWLALGVAFIGILGAMLALQLERAREFATLRALGMTPAQLGAMVTTQTGTMGFLSGLAAIPLGVIMAWVLIEVINRRAFGWQIDMQVTLGILSGAVLFAVGAALLAGVYPAYRSSQVSPASAMREE